MTQADHSALAYLARKDVSGQWRHFLLALLDTLDVRMDRETRDGMLRAVGERFAASMPLAASATLAALEVRMNEALASISWGQVLLELDERAHNLRVVHSAAPCVSAPGDEDGAWLGPVLEGLYSAWLNDQQGGGSSTSARVESFEPGLTVLLYGA